MPVEIRLRRSAQNYFDHLDGPMQKRVREKLQAIAQDPLNISHSKMLYGSDQRTARVGSYRILFRIAEGQITVMEIDNRGDVYKSL